MSGKRLRPLRKRSASVEVAGARFFLVKPVRFLEEPELSSGRNKWLADFVTLNLVGWWGVVDGAGSPVSFSTELARKLPYNAMVAICDAIVKSERRRRRRVA